MFIFTNIDRTLKQIPCTLLDIIDPLWISTLCWSVILCYLIACRIREVLLKTLSNFTNKHLIPVMMFWLSKQYLVSFNIHAHFKVANIVNKCIYESHVGGLWFFSAMTTTYLNTIQELFIVYVYSFNRTPNSS